MVCVVYEVLEISVSIGVVAETLLDSCDPFVDLGWTWKNPVDREELVPSRDCVRLPAPRDVG